MNNELYTLKEELFVWLKEQHKHEEHDGLRTLLADADAVFEEHIDHAVHEGILKYNRRPDGRKLDELRPITVEAGILPRTHGTGLFTRGQTQALSILTLAEPGAEQWIETPETKGKKHFMHHYNFPPYAPGEVGRIGSPGRREIGHGALAERALIPVIPQKEKFPYTIRIVSEILSSNGSTSMAAVCGASIALMDGGVPIDAPVGGISMGLMLSPDTKTFKILTDIQGPEDHHGDMDLKIAGTRKGITAIQMDVKGDGVVGEILEAAFAQSYKARMEILDAIEKILAAPRKELSPWAPRIFTLQINQEKIRDVIGPRGKMINEIMDKTGATIDIEDDGHVFITAPSEEKAKKAMDWINSLTREIKPGEIFEGTVKRIMEFGAFVEILPGQEGLVHISELSNQRVKKVTDVVSLGQTVTVKVKNIDDLDRVNLTMKL